MGSSPLHQRLAGVLLHPTSLPSGQLDDGFAWLDYMASAGLRVWQVLPLGVPHADRSPYQCLSAFAINPALLSTDQIPPAYPADSDFALWRAEQSHWLEDYALFTILKRLHHDRAWYHWPVEHKDRHAEALQQVRLAEADALLALEWQQYQLHRYWQQLHHYAGERGIFLFGDMPIYVAHDSADVWANRDRFLLDDEGQPTVVAGVPPDYFSETGQRWGNPHYNWELMEQQGFRWWLERLHNHFELFDIVRIDHFRAMEAAWMIDAECETAVDGHWQPTPGDALLQILRQETGEIPLIAEDLGIITEAVTKLRTKYNLPGMSILQFSFDSFEDNPHKPQNITPDRVVYTGTHDNDTSSGWFDNLDDETQQKVLHDLDITDTSQVVDALIDTALGCDANLAIIPLQDLLKLGSDSRMNVPGTMENNWRWQFEWPQLTPQLAASMQQRIAATNRQ
jgi:4-alpha-glucanotransferase